MVTPTSSDPARPGPSVTATASMLRPIVDAGLAARVLEDGDHPAQVGAGGNLGHDPACCTVQRHLAGHNAGHDLAAVLDHGHGGLVARRLDGKDAAARGAAHEPVARWSPRSSAAESP